MLRILIVGDRDLRPGAVYRWLDAHLTGPAVIIHGARRGADEAIAALAGPLAVEIIPFEGKGTALVRNRWLLDVGKPDLVLALLPGDAATTDCCRQARKRGVAVLTIGRSAALNATGAALSAVAG
jgi:hypothetical protein